jgi:hypothetical protein
VAVEGKQKEMTVRKAMDPQQHDTTTNDAPFCSEPIKTLTEALDALFSSPPSSLPLRYLVQSSDSMSLFLQMIVMVIEDDRGWSSIYVNDLQKELHCVPNRYVFKSRFSTTNN